jgi:hypothetical protein
MPWAFWRWKVAEQMGWTLQQVDALTVHDWNEYFQIQDGIGKANNSILR